MIPNQETKDVQIVVRPHSVEEVDVSFSVMRILTQTPFLKKPENVTTKDLDKQAKIYIRLVYSDWSQKHAETEVREFDFKYDPGDEGISIRASLQPSGVRPSI